MLEAARLEVAAQADHWMLWAPVAAGLGAAAYLGLLHEPRLWASAACFLVLVAAAVAAWRWGQGRGLPVAVSLSAFVAAGFLAGGVRTLSVAAPLIPSGLGATRVEGWVLDVVSASAERPRLLIAPTRIEGLDPDRLPRRIRVTLRDGELVGPGASISVLALTNPPPPPASPGAYDFARDSFFQQVGGSGLALQPPAFISLPVPARTDQVTMAVNAFRWSLARRLVDQMGPRTGGLAAALVSGHQAWITEADTQAMRDSGLAHILSISGVHMAIVGGFVFAAIRLLIAAWPWAALRAPGKKIAAAGALMAVLAYLVVSGAPPPAVRSAITAGVAFLAILLDRRALTLHSLAIAALAILLLQPEAVAEPGFQMSFAATAALLALAEAWPHPTREIKAPWPILLIQRLRTWFVAAVAVSFVAGLATDPFAIQHFNRVTLWGLPANLATEALSSFIVMPALALGAVGALMGGGGVFLDFADWGLKAVVSVAHTLAAWPAAVLVIAAAPAWTLTASFIGLLIICLWKGRLRWLGLPAFAAVALCPRPATPDAWIAPEGANAAVRSGSQAVVLRPNSQRFAFELWARRRGLAFPPDRDAAARADFDCGRDDCVPTAATSLKLATWRRRIPPRSAQLQRLCDRAEIVVVRTGSGDDPACAGRLVLDQETLARGGAAELYREPGGWRVVWAQDLRGRRPWSVRPDGDEPASDSGG